MGYQEEFIKQQVLMTQISWVIKLVLTQWALLTQISLVIKLVLTQQTGQSNFLGNKAGACGKMLIRQILFQAGNETTDASNSNFLGNQLVLMQQMLISNFLGWRLVMAQQLLIIQISFNYAGYQSNKCL
jgi:hypothetical protein